MLIFTDIKYLFKVLCFLLQYLFFVLFISTCASLVFVVKLLESGAETAFDRWNLTDQSAKSLITTITLDVKDNITAYVKDTVARVKSAVAIGSPAYAPVAA